MGGRVVVRVIANKQSTLALLLPLPLPLVRVSPVRSFLKLSLRQRLTNLGPETCHFQPCIGHCTSQ
jgi:hypothetical protein